MVPEKARVKGKAKRNAWGGRWAGQGPVRQKMPAVVRDSYWFAPGFFFVKAPGLPAGAELRNRGRCRGIWRFHYRPRFLHWVLRPSTARTRNKQSETWFTFPPFLFGSGARRAWPGNRRPEGWFAWAVLKVCSGSKPGANTLAAGNTSRAGSDALFFPWAPVRGVRACRAVG
jgi:hypothetical protein